MHQNVEFTSKTTFCTRTDFIQKQIAPIFMRPARVLASLAHNEQQRATAHVGRVVVRANLRAPIGGPCERRR